MTFYEIMLMKSVFLYIHMSESLSTRINKYFSNGVYVLDTAAVHTWPLNPR